MNSQHAHAREGLIHLVAGSLDRACFLAWRVLNDWELAQDAVQEACVRFVARPPVEREAGALRGCFMRAVHNSAVNLLRSERARRVREEAYAMNVGEERARPGANAVVLETARAARAELTRLPQELRVAVCLCCEEGFSVREAARILELPHSTVSDRVRQGLDRLRRSLAASGFASLGAAALGAEGLGEALRSLGLPEAPARVTGALRHVASPGRAVSAVAAKGGFAMKLVAGILLAGAVATGVAVVSGGPEPLPAEAEPTGHKDFEYTTLGKTFRIEWAAFSGVVEHLDGPGREGMGRQMGGSSTQGCLRGMQSDVEGNLYMCDMTSGQIRVLRRRDRMLLTISGNGHVTAGRVPEKQGPAYSLNLDQNVYIAAVGKPLEGEGNLYLATQGRVLRLFRNEAKGGLWWYELLAGGGPTAIRGPGEYDALAMSLREPRVVVSPDGKVGVIRTTGGGGGKRNLLFWLQDGKLVPAYDEKALGTKFSCYGFDNAGNFIGAGGGGVMVVAPDGKTIKHKIKVPFPLRWGVYPDRKRERWFVKGMDHYAITRVTPDGKTATLMLDGSWYEHKEGMDGRGYNVKGSLGWMWCLPLQDGRFVGWNSHGCPPLFVGTWLEGGK